MCHPATGPRQIDTPRLTWARGGGPLFFMFMSQNPPFLLRMYPLQSQLSPSKSATSQPLWFNNMQTRWPIFDMSLMEKLYMKFSSQIAFVRLVHYFAWHRRTKSPRFRFFVCLDIGNQYRAFNLAINISFIVGEHLAKYDTPSLFAL